MIYVILNDVVVVEMLRNVLYCSNCTMYQLGQWSYFSLVGNGEGTVKIFAMRGRGGNGKWFCDAGRGR